MLLVVAKSARQEINGKALGRARRGPLGARSSSRHVSRLSLCRPMVRVRCRPQIVRHTKLSRAAGDQAIVRQRQQRHGRLRRRRRAGRVERRRSAAAAGRHVVLQVSFKESALRQACSRRRGRLGLILEQSSVWAVGETLVVAGAPRAPLPVGAQARSAPAARGDDITAVTRPRVLMWPPLRPCGALFRRGCRRPTVARCALKRRSLGYRRGRALACAVRPAETGAASAARCRMQGRAGLRLPVAGAASAVRRPRRRAAAGRRWLRQAGGGCGCRGG
jgi:hypothetical protein